MYVVEVIPLERNVWTETLTYFSAKKIGVGSLVAVPLRSKSINALVVGTKKASEEKTSIKKSKFGMKKVSKVLRLHLASDALLKASEETARFYATSLGTVLASIHPLPLLSKIPESKATPAHTARTTIQILQTDDEDRFTQYRSLVREAFRHKESVFFLVPTIQDAESAYTLLSKGIEKYSVLMHSKKTKKALQASITHMYQKNHPLLIVSTPGYIGIACDLAGTIIVERENAPAYKQMMRPFLDFKFLIRRYAHYAHTRIIMGDTLLSTERIAELYEHDVDELTPLRWRANNKIKTALIDMHPYKPNLKGTVRALSDELLTLVDNTRVSSDKLIIFSGRKGLAPTTICGDCGSILTCNKCGHPTVLHQVSEKKRFYLCHRCGEKMDTSIRCKTCTSWKLAVLGVGTQLVEQELKVTFKGLTIIRMDRESAKDRKQALQLIEKFYQSPGAVLIGTEFALPYLTKPVGGVAVASIDEFFSIPDFRINERISYLLLKLKNLAERQFLIQTRTEDNLALKSVIEGNISGFFQSEIDMRKTLNYPPFSVPIKITLSGDKKAIANDMHILTQALTPYTLHVFPVLLKQGRGKTGLTGIVKVPVSAWPDERILSLLQTLPRNAEINVDPESFT